jgi:hypothetical protein
MLKRRVRISRVGLRLCIALSVLILPLSLLLVLGQTAAAPRPARHYASHSKYFHSGRSHKKSAANSNSQKTSKTISISSTAKPTVTPASLTCNFAAMHQTLSSSSSPILRKIAEYEQACGGGAASRVMLFTNLPANTQEASPAAADFAKTLKEFARFNIQPLVLMEPTTGSGVVNFRDYSNGAFDSALDSYFQALKNNGITDSSMGMWVYFPEADMSYPAGSTGWDNGKYTSLAPYISGIPKGLIDSFGLQGFPWVPAANVKGTNNLNPATFLSSSIAAEAAKILGTQSIWLNTGTFKASYTNSAAATVSMTPLQRQAILNGVIAQVSNLRSTGFKTAVNLFAQDKSKTSEAIDWSYWKSGQLSQSTDTATFTNFAGQLHGAGAELWLFDTY